MRVAAIALAALGISSLTACEGTLISSEHVDSGAVAPDAAGVAVDTGTAVPVDAWSPPAVDAAMTTSPDAYIAPLGDCTMGTPLDLPIAGCMPAPMPSTGDPAEDCVRRINQFRCECQHLPPLMRWRDGEACANQMAQYDSEHPGMAHAGFIGRICSGGYAQNECPGWPSVDSTVSGCLQQMWDEGPGDFYGPPAHGHYLNMSSTSFSMVACGFYEGPSGVYAAQNFQ
ncbi:MAG: CAP domain-containing protein [Sandaracinaceae bacterium]|nr:CAP domain-containing protein [Sandaracinaceae bacterium]